jgi:hypothetical protein
MCLTVLLKLIIFTNYDKTIITIMYSQVKNDATFVSQREMNIEIPQNE